MGARAVGISGTVISAVTSIVLAAITAYVTLHTKQGALQNATQMAQDAQAATSKATVQLRDAQLQLGVVVWRTADLLSPWAPTKDYFAVEFAKDISGFVHLRGRASSTVQGENYPMIILPEGYRPAYFFEGPASCDEVGSQHVSCAVLIRENGRVYFDGKGSSAALDGVTFSTVK